MNRMQKEYLTVQELASDHNAKFLSKHSTPITIDMAPTDISANWLREIPSKDLNSNGDDIDRGLGTVWVRFAGRPNRSISA